jgi:hypothetical protein
MEYLKTIEVTGDAFWVGTKTPDKFDTKGRYTMVVGNLSPAEVKKIEDIGGKVNVNPNKEQQGKFIKLKSGFPIPAHTKAGEQLDFVGNGSKIKVVVSPSKWDFAGKSGVNYWVGKKGVTVLDLVVYEGSPVDTDDETL